MLSYASPNGNYILNVGRDRLNNNNNNNNKRNNVNDNDVFVDGMTTGTSANNVARTGILTRSRSSNEDEFRKIDNCRKNVFNKNVKNQGQSRSPGRRSSLTSPQRHQLRRNCLVRSYNSLNTANKTDHHDVHHKPIKPNLKRVSFGSSKGSMVETLIYDHQEDENSNSNRNTNATYRHYKYTPPAPPMYHHLHYPPPRRNGYYRANIIANGQTTKSPLRISTPEEETTSEKNEEPSLRPARVKVTFLESQKPDVVLSPESPYLSDLNVPIVMSTPTPPQQKSPALRQGSLDSGDENPFRPDGELSKEADSIVELIKEGKPITPTKGENGIATVDGAMVQEEVISPVQANSVESAKPGTNGTTPQQTMTVEPGSVEVQHAVVAPPGEPVQVEHVNIKKKPKCKCCVIQ